MLLKSHIPRFSSKHEQVTQRLIGKVSADTKHPLSMEDGIRTVYPVGWIKCSVRNSRVNRVRRWTPEKKNSGEYNNVNVLNITTKINMLIRIAKHIDKCYFICIGWIVYGVVGEVINISGRSLYFFFNIFMNNGKSQSSVTESLKRHDQCHFLSIIFHSLPSTSSHLVMHTTIACHPQCPPYSLRQCFSMFLRG